MTKKKVYLETSVISYLTARPTTDVIKLAKQELTRRRWDNNRAEYASKSPEKPPRLAK